MAEKVVKQILRKRFVCDFRECILKHNSLVISLDATPAQILHSRVLKTELPIIFKNMNQK